MSKLLIATRNQGKFKEIKALLGHQEFELISPSMLGLDLQVEETGNSYAQNAELKSQAYARASGLMALGDDSGLEIDLLGGEPGLYSARYAPWPDPSYAELRAYLLGKLESHPRPWKARFRCVAALTTSQGETHFAQGTCPGEIIPEERGSHGFGYDPIFLVESTGKTMAELTMGEKNQLSHRARAVKAIQPILKKLMKN